MSDRPWRISLVGSTANEASRLQRALSMGVPGQKVIVTQADLACGADGKGGDLIFVDLDNLGDRGTETIEACRRQSPGVPLIAIGRSGEETRSIQALQAGAQDCLGGAELDGPPLIRAVRYAIERSLYQARLDEAREQDSRDREVGGLNALGGPARLPISERSLGTASLLQRAPEEFDDFVRRYGELLDRALLGRSVQDMDKINAELNLLADSLGILGAGPRDVVDLHKAAITVKLDGPSARKNRAYIEEGRLLLVQLMGYLASFYRNLSWGRGPGKKGQPQGRDRDSRVAPPRPTGDKPL